MLRALVVVAFSLPVIAFAQGAPSSPSAAPDPAAPPTAPPGEAGAPAVPEAPVPDQAQPPPEEPPVVEPSKFPAGLRLMLSDLTILRVNPIGVETRARFGLQKKLYPSTKKITENNFWFVGVFPKLNPASAHLGVGGEIQPASIFNLRVFGEVQKYFGSFGYLQSFASANANYSDKTLADNKDMPTPTTEPQSATVTHFSMQPMLQLKFGKIALRALFLIDYWDFKVRSGDTTAYEATFDTLLPDKGWSISTDTDLLYVTGTGLAAGLRHSWVYPMYGDKHFASTAEKDMYDGENNHQRLGFFGAYTLKDKGPSSFNKPTVIVIASWYLKHKYRAGEKTIAGHDADDFRSRAFPYFLVGFAFESDFLAVR